MLKLNKTNLLVLATMLPFLATPALACDGHDDECLSENRYSSIAECNMAIARDENDFHAWLDRAVLETQAGLDEAAAADFEKAGKVLDASKQPTKIAKGGSSAG